MENYYNLLNTLSSIIPAGAEITPVFRNGKVINAVCKLRHGTWIEILKPHTHCISCGHDQVYADMAWILAKRNCPTCGASQESFRIISFIAPHNVIRQRVFDQLDNGPGPDLMKVAKLLGVSLSN